MSAQDDGMDKWGPVLQGLGMKNTETMAEWRARTDRDAEALALLGLAATAFRTGFVPPSDWLPRAHALLGLPESNQPLRVGVNHWPFVESPGDFTNRLCAALNSNGNYLLGAVRNVLIENPPVVSDEFLQRAGAIYPRTNHQPYG